MERKKVQLHREGGREGERKLFVRKKTNCIDGDDDDHIDKPLSLFLSPPSLSRRNDLGELARSVAHRN